MMTELEQEVDKTLGNVNHFGSVILEAPTDEVVEFFSENWGLPSETISGILDVLTFDPTANKDSLASSVFLRTSNGLTQLLCWMAQPGDPGKTVSLALARKSKEKLYDSLITEIEQHRVAEVTTQLEYRGLVSRPGKKLVADGLQSIRISGSTSR